MQSASSPQSQRFGLRLSSLARALPAVLALAALALPTRSLAQAPTFNALITTYQNGASFASPNSAAVADFNGDGKLDAIVTDGGGTLHIMLGNGDGSFSVHNYDASAMTTSNVVELPAGFMTALPHPVDGYGAIRVADVNGDGKPDLVVLMGVHLNFAPLDFVTVMINTGNDANGVPQFAITHYYAWFQGLRSLTIGDLNGDGKPDFIVGNAGGVISVYKNNGGGTFTRDPNYFYIQPSAGGPSVGPGLIADFNGDGKADFLVTSNQAHATNIFWGNGDGTFQGATPANSFQPTPLIISSNGMSPVATDFNNDGKLDFMTVDFNTGNMERYLNNGNGTFSSPTVTASGLTNPSSLVLADINGDGKLDVLMSDFGSGSGANGVAIKLGNGDGTFGAPYYYSVNQRPVNLVVADYNNDGKPDISTLSPNQYNPASFAVLTNTTPAPLPTQTLTILGGNGSAGSIAPNVEYYNPATGNWQPAYLTGSHPWGFINGTNSWINYKTNTSSDPGAGITGNPNSTLWYLYRVRFTVPADAVNPQMTFSANADNFTQVAINGVTTGGSTQFINYANVPNVIVGGPGVVVQFHADSTSTQSIHPGENTITLNIGDWGGLNGFNFRIDLSMQSSQPIVIVTPPADTTPPVITAPSSITKEATSSAGAVVTFTATANDAVSGSVPVTASPASGSTFAIGISSVSLTATDAAGNTAHAGIAVNVVDTTAPVVAAHANVTAEATSASGAAVTYAAPTATDAVGVTSVTSTPASGSTFALGTTTVTATAKDAAGNTGTGSFTVTVQDTTAPALTVPANITAEATSASGAAVTFSASASDAVTASPAITYSAASGSTFALGTTTVTVTAKDAALNTATSTFTVTVKDTTPPALTVPASMTVEATSSAGASATFAATATDAVGVASLTYSAASGSTFALGATTVTVTAKDAAGNTSTGSFTITVKDTTAPRLTVPANMTVEATSAAGAVATFAATATDAVTASPTITYSAASGSTFPIGVTTVNVTAKDAAGNTSTGSFTITVRDTTAPGVTATMTPRGGGDDESAQFFTLAFSATDLVGVKTLTAVLNGVTVTNGQVVQLQTIKSGAQSVKRDDGKLQIKATSFALVVTATDAAGNTTTKTVVPVFVKNGKDSEDKGGNSSSSSDKTSSDDKNSKDK